MKKNRKTGNRTLPRQETDLALVRGGGISGGALAEAIVGGGLAPAENGVIHIP